MEYDPDVHNLECPKCVHGMDEVTFEGITIDHCTNCVGLWFDADEAQQLKIAHGSESLDAGGP